MNLTEEEIAGIKSLLSQSYGPSLINLREVFETAKRLYLPDMLDFANKCRKLGVLDD